MSQHDTLTWPQAVDISNLPEVHEAIQAFTDDATEDNAVAIILAVSTALSATQPAQAAQSDGRGTDAQIEKERDIARHAIVGSLAAGYAGQVHPGADHWLAAAHEAGARIKELEAQAVQPSSEDVRELSKWLNEGNTSPINRQALARVLHAAQGAQGEPEGVEYFAYSDEMGFETFKTRDEAIICAQESITIARSEARHDGEWSDDVSTIRWGVTIAKAQEVELDVHEPGDPPCVDYVLTASTTPPAQPAVAQGAGEVVGRVRIDSGEVHFVPHVRDADVSPLKDGAKLYTHPTPAQPAPVDAGWSKSVQSAYAWAVSGLPTPFYGPHAESDARAEARRCGGTAEAFPLFKGAQSESPMYLSKKLRDFKEQAEADRTTQPESDDRAMLEVIDERDRCHEWADKLAEAIASHTGFAIGEHSSANNPWSVALEALESHECEQTAKQAAQGAGEVVADLKRLSSVCPELNLNNYGPDDVDELNAWAIEVAQAIDQLADTAQPAPVVPEGWKLVPMKCDEAMKDVGIQFEFATVADGRLLAQTMWSELLAATPTPPAQEAKSAFTKALEIRTAQGWELTGEAIPVLYTDTINDQQVMRDDVWICTTAALKPAQAAADARDAFERWYVTHIREQIEMACTQQEITELREGDAYGDRAYLNGAWYGYQAALATHQQGGK